MKYHCRFCAIVCTFLLFGFSMFSTWGYTQSGVSFYDIAEGVPMGHEWVTRMAAIELLGYAPPTPPDIADPNDPRKNPAWKPRPRNTDLTSEGAKAEVARIKGNLCTTAACERYAARYKAVFDAIVGERWVDIGGYNVINGKAPWAENCWDAVAQEPAEVQNDHFMRRYDDRGGAGGVNAAYNSQVRFIKYFIAAAMAPPTTMNVYDGGAAYSTAVDVDRNYFLFGRAVHLFEDSFSSEHTVRTSDDNYTTVRQVKSYLCAAGSEQHSHSNLDVFNYKSGDVVWNPGSGLSPGWSAYKASNMKTEALAATEATIDLWAAFIRTMGTPMAQRQAVAVAEAKTLVQNWLSFDEEKMTAWYDNPLNRGSTYVLANEQSGTGQTVKACMVNLGVKSGDQLERVRELEETQKKCLYNATPWDGYEDLFDTSMHAWYSWRWKNPIVYLSVPEGWKIPDHPADDGVRVRIKSVVNGQYLSAPGGIGPDALVYAKPGTAPLDFIRVGTNKNGVYRVANAPSFFLSYRLVTGAVKLYQPYGSFSPGAIFSVGPSNFETIPPEGGTAAEFTFKSIPWGENGYMWLNSSAEPYISATDKNAQNARWYVEPLGSTVGAMCCWNRLNQGCAVNSTCDPTGEGCIFSGMNTKQYGTVQCGVAKCCWNRLIQGCSLDSNCDGGGEGCITSGTNTYQYGHVPCDTCKMQGKTYDPSTATCTAITQ